jgi:hypothetical protein
MELIFLVALFCMVLDAHSRARKALDGQLLLKEAMDEADQLKHVLAQVLDGNGEVVGQLALPAPQQEVEALPPAPEPEPERPLIRHRVVPGPPPKGVSIKRRKNKISADALNLTVDEMAKIASRGYAGNARLEDVLRAESVREPEPESLPLYPSTYRGLPVASRQLNCAGCAHRTSRKYLTSQGPQFYCRATNLRVRRALARNWNREDKACNRWEPRE